MTCPANDPRLPTPEIAAIAEASHPDLMDRVWSRPSETAWWLLRLAREVMARRESDEREREREGADVG